MSYKLELNNIVRNYGSFQALKSIDLQIEEGEFISLLGPSGCGKSTTIRLVAGLDNPTDGEIRIDGDLVSSAGGGLPPEKRNIGMVFQSYAVWPHMTVFDNVAFPLKMAGRPKAEIESQVRKTLALVGLDGFETRSATMLSGGQQQRVSLARALAPEPAILLLDEPLSNLDAKLRETMRFEIRAIQQRVGITTIFVTHSQEEALTMSDRVAVMNGGIIQQIGTPEEIYHRPKNGFVAGFVGLANILPALAESCAGDRLRLQIADGISIVCDHAPDLDGKRCQAMIRPESITVSPGDALEASGDLNSVRGVIDRVSFGGNVVDYFITSPGTDLTWRAQTNPKKLLASGTEVTMTFGADDVRVLPLDPK
ncbi:MULTISPECIES: ABC transporter ATP-binding protein [Martelella]|uniref:Iron(III) transport system ATP-binding protein n=2 Tax=Martelella TaxID=293088 RepID=A0A4R3NCW9_9HYPH|nr:MULTISPECIES: ABC transporter ATP-binding protein [Martelella]MBB4124696.1 iron(III) transport system ATP-binding protein [Martelella radicis]TCT28533.1 iron(III) transport system ATP-binding protein [Martelella mediterranea]